jgi:DNA-binding MarR family transcriptional regulator
MFFFFLPNNLAVLDPALEKFESGLSFVRARYPQMTVGALESLVYIARNQSRIFEAGMSLKDLARELAVRYPTLTRHTDILGGGVAGKGGLQLLEKVPISADQKERRVELTEGGMNFLSELVSTITNNQAELG